MGQDKVIRLIFPQWHGANISSLVPEIRDPMIASQGYCLGSELLNWLAPETDNEILRVPVRMDEAARTITDGIYNKDSIIKQTEAAIEILQKSSADKIVTLGGECSVSVAPFTYLARHYNNDVAIIWIDAHPDITLPGDAYPGYHAMALAACLGKGDKDILEKLPAKIDPSNALIVGIRDWEREEIKVRQNTWGIHALTPTQLKNNLQPLNDWLKKCQAQKVLIHFDLDVLDPKEIIAAVGVVPDGLSIKEVLDIIHCVSEIKEIVGLTVAEPMPRQALILREMLKELPLI